MNGEHCSLFLKSFAPPDREVWVCGKECKEVNEMIEMILVGLGLGMFFPFDSASRLGRKRAKVLAGKESRLAWLGFRAERQGRYY